MIICISGVKIFITADSACSIYKEKQWAECLARKKVYNPYLSVLNQESPGI